MRRPGWARVGGVAAGGWYERTRIGLDWVRYLYAGLRGARHARVPVQGCTFGSSAFQFEGQLSKAVCQSLILKSAVRRLSAAPKFVGLQEDFSTTSTCCAWQNSKSEAVLPLRSHCPCGLPVPVPLFVYSQCHTRNFKMQL